MEYKVKKYEKGVFGITLEDEIGNVIMESAQTFTTELEAEVAMKRIRTWAHEYIIVLHPPHEVPKTIRMPFIPQRKSLIQDGNTVYGVDEVFIETGEPNTAELFLKIVSK